ncbi:MAG: hypothetical protein ACRDRF_00625 [Pseudonocardiaceae bacterium]
MSHADEIKRVLEQEAEEQEALREIIELSAWGPGVLDQSPTRDHVAAYLMAYFDTVNLSTVGYTAPYIRTVIMEANAAKTIRQLLNGYKVEVQTSLGAFLRYYTEMVITRH